MIITLEDWLLISPPLRVDVNERVRLKLLNSNLPEDYLITMPFTLTSVNSFEIACNSILENGIQSFMNLKVQGEYQAWDKTEFSIQIMPAKQDNRNCIFSEVLQIFKDEAKKLLPEY